MTNLKKLLSGIKWLKIEQWDRGWRVVQRKWVWTGLIIRTIGPNAYSSGGQYYKNERQEKVGRMKEGA